MARNKYYYVEAKDEFGEPDTGVTAVAVYKSSGSQLATLYTDPESQTSLTNPITGTDLVNSRGARFWSADSLVDVQITSASGLGMRTSLVGDKPNILIQSTNSPIKAIKKTIGLATALDATGANCDYQFDDVSSGSNEDVVTMTDLIPAHASIINMVLECTVTVVGVDDSTMSIDVGNASGGGQFLTAADTDSAADINSVDADSGCPIQVSASAVTVYVNANPTDEWEDLSAGQWQLVVAYIDFGAYL